MNCRNGLQILQSRKHPREGEVGRPTYQCVASPATLLRTFFRITINTIISFLSTISIFLLLSILFLKRPYEDALTFTTTCIHRGSVVQSLFLLEHFGVTRPYSSSPKSSSARASSSSSFFFIFQLASASPFCDASTPVVTGTATMIQPSTADTPLAVANGNDGTWMQSKSTFGVGCILGPASKITFSGASLPVRDAVGQPPPQHTYNGAVSAATMGFIDGAVMPQGHIAISGPQRGGGTADPMMARLLAPMVVLISGNRFQNGSAILVEGHLPPDSNITISANFFDTSSRCALLTRTISTFNAVVVIADVVPMSLFARASIRAEGNFITSASGTNRFSVPFMINSLIFYGNASCVFNKNNVQSHGNVTGGSNTWMLLFHHENYIVGAPPPAFITFAEPGGLWALNDNSIELTTENSGFVRVCNMPGAVNISGNGVFSLRGNRIIAKPISTTTQSSLFGASSGNPLANCSYIFEGNYIEVHGYSNVIYTLGGDFFGHSLVDVSNNRFVCAGSNSILTLNFLKVQLSGPKSRFFVQNNSFLTLVGSTRASGSTIAFAAGFSMADRSTLVLHNNRIAAEIEEPNATAKRFVSMNSDPLITSSPHAASGGGNGFGLPSVSVCQTVFYSSHISRRLQLPMAFDTRFLSMPVELCPTTNTLSASLVVATPSITAQTMTRSTELSYRSPSASALRLSKTSSDGWETKSVSRNGDSSPSSSDGHESVSHSQASDRQSPSSSYSHSLSLGLTIGGTNSDGRTRTASASAAGTRSSSPSAAASYRTQSASLSPSLEFDNFSSTKSFVSMSISSSASGFGVASASPSAVDDTDTPPHPRCPRRHPSLPPPLIGSQRARERITPRPPQKPHPLSAPPLLHRPPRVCRLRRPQQ